MGIYSSKSKKNTWKDALHEMESLSKRKNIKIYEAKKKLKGGNGFPFILENSYFCKLQFKKKNALNNLMNIKRIKDATKSSSDNYLCNLIKYHETSQAVFFIYKKYNMDLAQLLNSQKTRIKPVSRHKIIMSIANAIIYLHDKGHAHRDIKVENILMRTPDHAVLCDLDNALPLNDYSLKGTKEYYPTINVMKALICNRKDISIAGKMKWIDYYAFGKTICYVMIMTSEKTEDYQILWTKWLNISRTSCFPYLNIIEVLAERSIWWNIIYKLCIVNERHVFNPSKKMFHLKELILEINDNF